MHEIAGYEFPDNPIDRDAWKPIVHRRALHHDVIAVACTRAEGAWAAYIGAVPGQNHDDEQDAVLREGGKLPADVAKVLFPRFALIPYAK